MLFDTSARIAFFRGKGALAARVDALIEGDDAATCGPVLTELQRGLRNAVHALHADVAILANDKDFATMRAHGIPLLLA